MFIQEKDGEFIVCRNKGKIIDGNPSRKQIVTAKDWFRVVQGSYINLGIVSCPKGFIGKKFRVKLIPIKNEPIVRRVKK